MKMPPPLPLARLEREMSVLEVYAVDPYLDFGGEAHTPRFVKIVERVNGREAATVRIRVDEIGHVMGALQEAERKLGGGQKKVHEVLK